MGYTCGRKLTEELLKEIALKYKSRAEFQHFDSSAYTTARLSGILEKICEHMTLKSFSVPQKICHEIFNQLIREEGIYNSRKIIKPFELDIYYPGIKLAIEYNGKGWHNDEDSIRRDRQKKELCNKNGIFLFVISEKNRKYEEDIKEQIIKSSNILKTFIPSISEELVSNIKIDYNLIFNSFKSYDIQEILDKAKDCRSIKDFSIKFSKEYSFLVKSKQTYLLDNIRTIIELTDEELLEKCKEIDNYKDFVKSNLYGRCYKRGLLKVASSHMDRFGKIYTKEEIFEFAKKCKNRTEFKKKISIYNQAESLGLIEELFPNKYDRKWTIEKIKETAREFKNSYGLKKKFASAYGAARKLGILKELQFKR